MQCRHLAFDRVLQGVHFIRNIGLQSRDLCFHFILQGVHFAAYRALQRADLAEHLVLHFGNSRDSLFQQLGEGTIVLTDDDVDNIQKEAKGEKQKNGKGWKRLIPFWKPKETTGSDTAAPAANDEPLTIDRKKPIVLNEENLSRFTICPTCHPIPGDQVLGYLDDQNRVIIHKRKCPIADQLKTSDGNHILAAEWDTHRLLHFAATIHIEGIDRVGILRSLTDVITQQFNVNVHRLTIDTCDGLFQGDIELSVHDTEDVETIIKNLKSIDGLEEVTRIS